MVIEQDGFDKWGNVQWICQCDCGNKKTIISSNLLNGHTKSCGCYRSEITSKLFFKHGRYGTPEHRVWRGMIQRCTDLKCEAYKYYGNRGIKICDRWLNFMNFFSDMGKKSSPELTLERVDNNGDYESGNCRWGTRTEQNINQRIQKNNKSGVRGVSWNNHCKKYQTNITVNRHQIYLGVFKTIHEAAEARRQAEITYWGKPTCQI